MACCCGAAGAWAEGGTLFCAGSPCAVDGKGGRPGWLVLCAPTPAAQPTSRAAVAMPAIGFRDVAKDECDFVGDIEAGIGIVTFTRLPRHGQAITHEDDLAFNIRIGGKGQGSKILLDRELYRRAARRCDDEMVGVGHDAGTG